MSVLKIIFCIKFSLLLSMYTNVWGAPSIDSINQLTEKPIQYEKVAFDIEVSSAFSNPYDANDIRLDMILTSSKGEQITLPCFYISGDNAKSLWKARFTPSDTGNYSYQIELRKNNALEFTSSVHKFDVAPSAKNGFILPNNQWTFKYSSGKPFRGIGENVGWEAREWEDPKYTYDYFLPKLADNGANFIRTWMHAWNLPLEWKHVTSTDRYTDTDEYFNPGGIERMDELVQMCDSLGIYLMVALDAHGGFIESGEWPLNNYNTLNGGPVDTPAKFFTSTDAKEMYKNRLRYLVARWGYSTSIAVWEFFNEVDNAMYDGEHVIIPHADVTQWHTEMSNYLKNIDPYGHLVSTSISHREIDGLIDVPDFDFNMKHIYRYTSNIPSTIKDYVNNTGKPYVIGEFAYEWDWNVDFSTISEELDHDFKIGLWYGVFTPTPILPLSWWWEHFDERGMHEYFRGVRMISDQILAAGNGNINQINVDASVASLEVYAIKSGDKYFVYALNNNNSGINSADLTVSLSGDNTYYIKYFDPETLQYKDVGEIASSGSRLEIQDVPFDGKESKIYILSPDNSVGQRPYGGEADTIPGRIEAEDFDSGGEGVAYHDLEPDNSGGQYRTDEGVDIEISGAGGFNVTDIVRGEWLEYTVNVQTAGVYATDIVVASETDNGSFNVELDGKIVGANVEVPNTGGAQVWEKAHIEVPILEAGEHQLRIYFETTGINLDYFDFTLTNKASVVNIVAPEDGATFEYPVTIDIQANASDDDGEVSKITFFSGNDTLGADTESPYSLSWEPAVGEHNLKARVVDDKGLAVESDVVHVTVNPSQVQTPYGGAPHVIPGKIEAEDFDEGAATVAYSDQTAGNVKGEYRTDTDVDIETCTDDGGGYNLADIQAGEWVEFTVEVAEAGNYNFSYRVATQMDDQTFIMQVNGKNATGTIQVPNTGNWQNWETIHMNNIALPKGASTLRLTFESEYFNLNHFSAEQASETVTAIEHVQTSSKIYPNPTKNCFHVKPAEGSALISILNLQGVEVYANEIKSGSTLSVGHNMPSGIYLIVVQYENGYKEVFRAVKSL